MLLGAISDYGQAIELAPDVPEYYDKIMLAALAHGGIDMMLHHGELKYQNTDDKGLKVCKGRFGPHGPAGGGFSGGQ